MAETNSDLMDIIWLIKGCDGCMNFNSKVNIIVLLQVLGITERMVTAGSDGPTDDDSNVKQIGTSILCQTSSSNFGRFIDH